MATTPTKQINLCSVLSESRRLIKSQRRHFLSLGLLFLLPPTIVTATFPKLQSLLSDSIISLTFLYPNSSFGTSPDHDQHPAGTISTNTLLISLVYLLSTLALSLCAAGSITYTAFHGFYGEAIKPKSILNSIATSFFPLLATALISHAILFLIGVIFAFFSAAVIGGAWLLGFQTDPSSPYFLVFCASMVVLLVFVVIHLQVNWALASVVVVLESTWGFEALNRSRNLIKGRRWLAFSLSLIYGFVYVTLGWNITYPEKDENRKRLVLIFLFVVQVVLTSSFRVLVKISEMNANTALYVYCKANIREGKESGTGHYVRLVDDDEKV
ncbi:hypothetical protein L484_015716 [Morus notabilis]|uniref:Transmembrane protein n=1 Tax=Morus notabilis TaxID=981085 RepID=W9S0F3_9ROSA|nr:uncharacterized protein LOC21398799 [Morus notabilis]EXC20038.1 hypothetical protein L484_015716 [Morus notabilis]